MTAAQIEQVLRLVKNNDSAEDREEAIAEAARLLDRHLAAARADDKLLAAACALKAAHESKMLTVVEWRALSRAIRERRRMASGLSRPRVAG